MSLQSLERVAYATTRRLALCTELGKAHSSPLAIPHKDLLDGVLEPSTEAVVAAEVEAESESAVAVAAVIPPLVVKVWQFLRCCKPAVPAHFG